MNTSELLAAHLAGDLGMLKWHLDDFSDADFFVRPCPGANHAMWQVGHTIGSTGRLLAMVEPSFKTPVPESITSKFSKETSTIDDPAAFPKPAELREALGMLAEAARSWVARLSPATLDAKSPDWAKDWAATNGLLVAGLASHVQMHIGQVQVIRRRLGKPHLM